MRREAAAEQIGIGFNRGTNMHPISLKQDTITNPLKIAGEASTSWVIAAVVGAMMLGKSRFVWR